MGTKDQRPGCQHHFSCRPSTACRQMKHGIISLTKPTVRASARSPQSLPVKDRLIHRFSQQLVGHCLTGDSVRERRGIDLQEGHSDFQRKQLSVYSIQAHTITPFNPSGFICVTADNTTPKYIYTNCRFINPTCRLTSCITATPSANWILPQTRILSAPLGRGTGSKVPSII